MTPEVKAAWEEAIRISEAEQLHRGLPKGSPHGVVAYGCWAVTQQLKARLKELEE